MTSKQTLKRVPARAFVRNRATGQCYLVSRVLHGAVFITMWTAISDEPFAAITMKQFKANWRIICRGDLP